MTAPRITCPESGRWDLILLPRGHCYISQLLELTTFLNDQALVFNCVFCSSAVLCYPSFFQCHSHRAQFPRLLISLISSYKTIMLNYMEPSDAKAWNTGSFSKLTCQLFLAIHFSMFQKGLAPFYFSLRVRIKKSLFSVVIKSKSIQFPKKIYCVVDNFLGE